MYSGLFSFKTEEKTILQNGPYTVRVRESIATGIADYLALATKQWLTPRDSSTPVPTATTTAASTPPINATP
jgi:hypothetical protein